MIHIGDNANIKILLTQGSLLKRDEDANSEIKALYTNHRSSVGMVVTRGKRIGAHLQGGEDAEIST
jgi:hypothetical protein